MATEELSIVKMLQEQKVKSEDFTKQNFGLQLGSDYPDMARELLSDDALMSELGVKWLLGVMTAHKVAVKPGGPAGLARSTPDIHQQPLSFLYWGIQIGRELERRQAAALSEIAAAARREA